MSKKRFRPQICLILQQSCCLYSKSCCWIIRSCRYFSKVVSELSVFLTSWILARGDPFLKAHFQFGAELLLWAGEGISLTRRSKDRLGVPLGGAEQGSASRRRGMVLGKYSCNFWRRLFLGVFPTADKSRGIRPGTETTKIATGTAPLSLFLLFYFYNLHSCVQQKIDKLITWPVCLGRKFV